jgi:hypothetical protein
MPKPAFPREFTALQRSVIDRLAEIEQSDADACAGCGGEDCACCEIYHDRQRWVSPEELFARDDDDPMSWQFHRGEEEECDDA